MKKMQDYTHIPLKEPTPITEQIWEEGTLPLVSIGNLTYNHEPYIRDCIEGFLMQKTTFPVHIVIFEDCSTDNTAKILKEYQEKYPKLFTIFFQPENTYGKPIRQEARKPYYEARNKAKYIALCEGDDYWTDPLKLQRQVDFLEKNENVSLSVENGLVKNSTTNAEYLFNQEINEKFYSAYEMLQIRRFPTASVVFRAKYTEDALKLKFSADTILWVLLATKGKVYYNPVVSSVYNRGMHGVVEGTDRIKWAKTTKNWNSQMIEIIKTSSLNDDFDYNIFKERGYSEFWDAYTRYKWSKSPIKKILCIFECFKIKPKRTLKKFLK